MKNYTEIINELRAMNVRNLFEKVSNYDYLSRNHVEYSDDACFIFQIITTVGDGFVKDICEKAKKENRAISDKQAWCVAYALKKLTDDQVKACAESFAFVDAEYEAC